MGNRIEQEDGASAASSVFATPPEEFDTPPEDSDDVELEKNELKINENDGLNGSLNDIDGLQQEKAPHTHFDIYTLNIQSFQTAIGRHGHDWNEILNRGSSPHHLINSVNFSLQIKRQLILSYADEAWLDMNGELSEFTLNMSALQAQMLNNCLRVLKKDPISSQKDRHNKAKLRQSGELTQSKQAYNELEERERKKLDKIKEQRQIMIGFGINKIVVNLTDDKFNPLCAMQLEKLNWQFVKKPLSGQSSFDVASFVLVDHKASKLGEEYHFIISSSRRCGIDVGSGVIIDSGGPMTPTNFPDQFPRNIPKNTSNGPLNSETSAFTAETPGFFESVINKLSNPGLRRVETSPTTENLDELSEFPPLIQCSVVWYHSSSPDLHDKPVGVSYQTIELKLSSMDIVIQPTSWAHTVGIVDKITKQFEFASSELEPEKEPENDKNSEILQNPQNPQNPQNTPENKLSKPWHRTFSLELDTIHILLTRILQRGKFKGYPQKVMSMKVQNTQGVLVIDESQAMNLDARISGVIAHDLTNANPSASERLKDASFGKVNLNSPARLFSVGDVGMTDLASYDSGEVFQYLFKNGENGGNCENGENGDSLNGGGLEYNFEDTMSQKSVSDQNALTVNVQKVENTQQINMNIASINYVHSSRFLSELLDSVDQFESEWKTQISEKSREMMKSKLSSNMRKVMTDIGMEATFYKPGDKKYKSKKEAKKGKNTKKAESKRNPSKEDDIQESVPEIKNPLPEPLKKTPKVSVCVNISAPSLALPMTGYPDRLHMGNNYFLVCCPGNMRLENMERNPREELALFSLTMNNVNVYSVTIVKEIPSEPPQVSPRLIVVSDTDVRLKISRFSYVPSKSRDYSVVLGKCLE